MHNVRGQGGQGAVWLQEAMGQLSKFIFLFMAKAMGFVVRTMTVTGLICKPWIYLFKVKAPHKSKE